MSTFIIGEIGINHNGKVENALELIKIAADYGFDAVKFQKRNPELYPERLYESPILGQCTYRQHKRALELSKADYDRIDALCKLLAIDWFASCFDTDSVDFIAPYKPKYWKIASPCITDLRLVEYIARQPGKKIMSTGMSTMEEVREAVETIGNYTMPQDREAYILHCCSEYPTPLQHVNLRVMEILMQRLNERFEYVHGYYYIVEGIAKRVNLHSKIGYSSHDATVNIPVAAAAMGAQAIEVHITLDRAMPGSDHAASLERRGMETLVRHIRSVETALGSSEKQFYEGEKRIREKVKQVQKGEEG